MSFRFDFNLESTRMTCAIGVFDCCNKLWPFCIGVVNRRLLAGGVDCEISLPFCFDFYLELKTCVVAIAGRDADSNLMLFFARSELDAETPLKLLNCVGDFS